MGLVKLCIWLNVMISIIQSQTYNNMGKLFSISIPDLLNDGNVITSLSNELKDTGIFRLKNIFNKDTIKFLVEQLLNSPMVLSDKWTTAWQASTINENYPLDHPINVMTHAKTHYIGRSVMEQIFIDIYEYKPLLELFGKILSIQHGYDALYLSSDPHGSIYGRIGLIGDGGAWHFDQHPFSCVWMLQKPLNDGGQLRYVYMPPIKHETDNGINIQWDFELLSKIYANDSVVWNEYVKQLSDVTNGEIYCLQGNITLHDITPTTGKLTRVVFVTTYSDIEHFQHTDIVKENNEWNNYNKDGNLAHVDL